MGALCIAYPRHCRICISDYQTRGSASVAVIFIPVVAFARSLLAPSEGGLLTFHDVPCLEAVAS
jgi:hypothetical protein